MEPSGKDSKPGPTRRPRKKELPPTTKVKRTLEDVRVIIALVVTVVWAISFLLDTIPTIDYSPNPGIHGVMLVVVGAIFGTNLIKGDK